MSGNSAISDPYSWLEDIHGESALKWVEERNADVRQAFFDEEFHASATAIEAALNSEDNIAWVTKVGQYYYNFWRDAQHPRGLWRRTTWESYRSDNTDWDVLIDVDDLAAAEGTQWVWAGARIRRSDEARALIVLSPDGGDAVVYREFDMHTRTFVDSDAGGFYLPHAKCHATWLGDDALVVATDFGQGTLTTSTYPASARVLKRGQTLAQAAEIAQIPTEHTAIFCGVDDTTGFERAHYLHLIDLHHSHTWIRPLESVDKAQWPAALNNGWIKIEVPTDVSVEIDRDLILFRPRSDWHFSAELTVRTGSLAVVNIDEFLAGSPPRIVFEPSPSTSLSSWSLTRNYLLLNTIQDVQGAVTVVNTKNWEQFELQGVPINHTVSASAVDPDDEATPDDYWLMLSGFLTPSTLKRGTVGQTATSGVTSAGSGVAQAADTIKAGPELFDATGLTVTQHFATSLDDTRVPYFQVGPADLRADGSNPVYLDGYGGFEISLTPAYTPTIGIGWLAPATTHSKRGVYVVANIRGGGEYGPTWHSSALKENRHRSYEDFAAVARDLIYRGITQPAHLGCAGASNGGLLVGNMLTQYPDLFGAVSCGVPLLDMRRYTKLSAGQSWVAEYGDPETSDWEFIQHFSPYHLFDSQRQPHYPPVLFWTATSDDRVGPVQARKMAAKMMDAHTPNVYFFEDTTGGHSAAADYKQVALTRALMTRFMWKQLTGQ